MKKIGWLGVTQPSSYLVEHSQDYYLRNYLDLGIKAAFLSAKIARLYLI